MPLVLIFLVLAYLLLSVQSICLEGGIYTTNGTYNVNLKTALASPSTNVNINGFYNVSVGQNPDRVNAIMLCRGDVQLDKCRECIQSGATELLKSCHNQKQAIESYELCTLRCSNEFIFGTLETAPAYWLWNPYNATSPDQFKEDLRMLIHNPLALAAHGGSLRKVAAGNITAWILRYIYVLVQCTLDLSPEDCDFCLIGAAANIPKCCDGKIGGRVLQPSCYIRFERQPFNNEARLQELAHLRAPAPVPAPMRVPETEPKGEREPEPPIMSPLGNYTIYVEHVIV